MKNLNKFSLQIQETIKDNFYNPPEDELDELSEFEIGLKRFCFEQNRYVLIQLAGKKIQLHLYHDILDALEEKWCLKILELPAGNKASITFNDFFLEITPILNKNLAACEFTILGTGEYHHCTLYLSRFLDTMRIFLDEVLGSAVKEGYINAEDIAKYLGWQLNSIYL